MSNKIGEKQKFLIKKKSKYKEVKGKIKGNLHWLKFKMKCQYFNNGFKERVIGKLYFIYFLEFYVKKKHFRQSTNFNYCSKEEKCAFTATKLL